jgi:hypothetical protein
MPEEVLSPAATGRRAISKGSEAPLRRMASLGRLPCIASAFACLSIACREITIHP